MGRSDNRMRENKLLSQEKNKIRSAHGMREQLSAIKRVLLVKKLVQLVFAFGEVR